MVGETKPEHPLPSRRLPIGRRQLLMQTVVAGVILVSGIGIGTGGAVLALKDRIIPGMRLMPPDFRPGPDPNEIVTRWSDDYGLNDKQAQRAKETLTRQFAAIAELRQKFFQAEQQERAKFGDAMKKVLTAEQYTQWDADMKRMIEHMQRARSFDGRRGGRGGPRGERGPGRPGDPNERRWDGPPRPPLDGDGSRRGWPPRPPTDPNNRRGTWSSRRSMDPNGFHRDRPPEPPTEVSTLPGEANQPR
ncbi:MAG: hypothetical protein MUC88_09255 [Planctomycetes bacterium]|jgi:hypothetical protein|nr:hypothetical protein [Planctomycetota bacterium]